jgi:hypothetical protein
MSYTIGITASNRLGSGPTSITSSGSLSANKDGWDGLAKFVASAQPESVASFVLGPGVWNVSHPIGIANIDMTIQGSAAGGTVLDARKLCGFFSVTKRGTLRLHGPLTLMHAKEVGGTAAGGAIYAIGRSKVFVRGVEFIKCERGIWATDSRLELLDCDFTECSMNGRIAGGIAIAIWFSCTPYSSAEDDEDLHVVRISGSRFERNAATTSWRVRSYRAAISCSCALT